MRTTWTRTAASLLAACLALGTGLAGTAQAQQMPARAGTPRTPAQGTPIRNESESPLASRPTTAVYLTTGGAGQIQQVGQMTPRPKDGPDENFIFTVTTELPGPDRMFRRQSESEFFERIRQENRGKAGTGRIIFPESPPITREVYQKRCFPLMVENVEPGYVCHGRLLFEQPNFDRQGWNLGVVTPLVNLGAFYYDVATLPYHAATRPFQQTDCSAGKCLPGDRTPLYLYHEEFSVTGLVGQAGVVTGLAFLFP